ncbi:MAG: hypothetical protein AAGJ93_11990 [Bacteroidota bacterium]
MESSHINLRGTLISFTEGGHLDIDLFSQFLDEDRWSTDSCEMSRRRLCSATSSAQ